MEAVLCKKGGLSAVIGHNVTYVYGHAINFALPAPPLPQHSTPVLQPSAPDAMRLTVQRGVPCVSCAQARLREGQGME
jgi:hypothetical protein